jgi:hypothetical protein
VIILYFCVVCRLYKIHRESGSNNPELQYISDKSHCYELANIRLLNVFTIFLFNILIQLSGVGTACF